MKHFCANLRTIADLAEGGSHQSTLPNHLFLVLVQPGIPFLGVVQILGNARVRFAEVGADIVPTSQSCEIAALHRDGCRLGVVGHLDIEDERNLTRDLGGLPHEGVWTGGEGTALNSEALARVHLPEEANFAVFLREDPDTKKVATRDQWLVEVMARLPSALGTSVLGNGGIDCALVPELIDAQIHATCLLVVSVRLDLVRLGSSQHASLDGLFDEGSLPTRDRDPSPVQGIGFGNIARLRATCGPREGTTWQLERLVTIIEALAKCNLLLRELWARVHEVVVTKGAILF